MVEETPLEYGAVDAKDYVPGAEVLKDSDEIAAAAAAADADATGDRH